MEINNKENSKLSEQMEDDNNKDFNENLSELNKIILDNGLQFLYDKQNNKTTNFISCNNIKTYIKEDNKNGN